MNICFSNMWTISNIKLRIDRIVSKNIMLCYVKRNKRTNHHRWLLCSQIPAKRFMQSRFNHSSDMHSLLSIPPLLILFKMCTISFYLSSSFCRVRECECMCSFFYCNTILVTRSLLNHSLDIKWSLFNNNNNKIQENPAP